MTIYKQSSITALTSITRAMSGCLLKLIHKKQIARNGIR